MTGRGSAAASLTRSLFRRGLLVLPLAIAASLIALLSCTSVRIDLARAAAARIARPARLSPLQIDTGHFTLAAYQRIAVGGDDMLVVYFEGDGRAWLNWAQVSQNPTPTDPVALRLAAADDTPTVLYLARPCQFVTAEAAANCHPRYWSTARFAVEVVEAADRAVTVIKTASGKRRVELIGYSGGGVLATLVASRRGDVSRVITVAANLDLAFWATHHEVTPLTESLNPVDFVATLRRTPQVAFVGDRDKIVPPRIVERYRQAFPAEAPITVILIPDFSHACCWTEAWPELVHKARTLP